MKKYRSHKTVQAGLISKITFPAKGTSRERIELHLETIPGVNANYEVIPVSDDWYEKHSDNGSKALVGGYHVEYEDGYTSWSPAKAFEDGYSEVVE